MTNAKQRRQNRATARKLSNAIADSAICPECGKPGRHWLQDPAPFFGGDLSGWTCDKFYGPDGRRLPEEQANDRAE